MEKHVESKPIWVTVVRGFQFLFSIIILGLAAYIIHGKYFDEMGFSIACSLLTWLIVPYILVTEIVPSLHKFHHAYAVLGADAFMVIFWLSSMAAAAALRGTFKYKVNVESCTNDGSLVNSSTCVVSKRAAVATDSGLSIISAVAGLSALNMLLFIATLVYSIILWKRGRSGGGSFSQNKPEGYSMASHPQVIPQYQQELPTAYQQQTPQAYQQQTPGYEPFRQQQPV